MRTPLWGMGPPGNPANNEALGMGDNDRYATWDAAYVLGSLSAADRREFEGKVIGMDERTDVAVIKIAAKGDLPVVKLGDSNKLRPGQWVACSEEMKSS